MAALPSASSAQPAAPASETELARLRAMFQQGLRQEEEGRWAEALGTFEQVARAKRTSAVVFHLGLCHESLGKLALAHAEFSEAESLAAAEGAPGAEVRDKAARRRDAVDERVPKLRIIMPAGAEAKVSVNGTAWSNDALDEEVAVDPGAIRIVVEKDGRAAFEKELELAEGDRKTVRVKLEKEAAAVAPSKPKPPVEAEPETEPGDKVPAIVVGSIGLGSLAVGAVLFGLGQAAVAEVKETCNADFQRCDPEKEDLAKQGEVYHYTSIGLASGGVVLLGVATALWFTIGADSPKPVGKSAPSVSISLSPGGGTISGRF